MKVFISHSNETRALAQKVGEALKRAGWEVWNDLEILPGDNWAAKIGQALESSQAMVVLLTPEALNSPTVLLGHRVCTWQEDFQQPINSSSRWLGGKYPTTQASVDSEAFRCDQIAGVRQTRRRHRSNYSGTSSRSLVSDTQMVPLPNEVFLSHSSLDQGICN